MTSSRLPGKVLADVLGRPAIARLVDRLRARKLVDEIVIATTTKATDDVLVDWALHNDVAVFRGSEDDVLDRVVGAHEQQRSDIVVEICGDCLLTDPEIVDMGIRTYFENECDVVSSPGTRFRRWCPALSEPRPLGLSQPGAKVTFCVQAFAVAPVG